MNMIREKEEISNLLTTVIVALLCFLVVISIKIDDDGTKISLETKKYFRNAQILPEEMSKCQL